MRRCHCCPQGPMGCRNTECFCSGTFKLDGEAELHPLGVLCLVEMVQFLSLRAPGGGQGGVQLECGTCWLGSGPRSGGEVTCPFLGLREWDAPPAFRWESHVHVSSLINWRVETLPPSPQGIETLAETRLCGKPGHLFVGLPGQPRR